MSKMYLQWKDPDFCDARSGENPFDELSEEDGDILYSQLKQLGIGEYIIIEVDLDKHITQVVKRIPK
jgi:hypothetical protein